MKYRKKPAIIEAIQWTGSNIREIRHAFPEANPIVQGMGRVAFYSLGGVWVSAGTGEWIIRDQEGNHSHCHPRQFHEDYEAVEENDQ